jgi:hypothetical protein
VLFFIPDPVVVAMPGYSQATELRAWQSLAEHHTALGRNIVLKDIFEKDPSRFSKFSRTFENSADGSEILFDFSKNFLVEETLRLLVELAKECGLEKLRDDMFAGEKINFTEKRAVYHVALRNVSNWPMRVDGESVVEDVNAVLDHMKIFSEQVRSGEWKGWTGKKIKTIINIGIGGSDLYVHARLLGTCPISDPTTDPTRIFLVVPSWSLRPSSRMVTGALLFTSSPTLMEHILPKHFAIPTPKQRCS